MGFRITTAGAPSPQQNTFQAFVIINSDTQLSNPTGTLFASFAQVYASIGITPANWSVQLLYFARFTNPAPNIWSYSFTINFQLANNFASAIFSGPPGPPGATGPIGPPGQAGPGSNNAKFIWGVPIDSTLPSTEGEVLAFDPGTDTYIVRQLSLDDLAPAFAPTLSLASGSPGPLENGQVWTPTFTATPATNAVGITACTIQDSVGNTNAVSASNPLSPPTASGGHYTRSTAGSVTVTVTETQGITVRTTNGVSVSFLQRSFGGVGAAGASGATSTGNNATLSTGDVIAGALYGNVVGSSFGPFSPTLQKIYLVLPHTGYQRTFKDGNGFAFPMNTSTVISFTNQYLVVETLDIYESTVLLSTVNPYFVIPQS